MESILAEFIGSRHPTLIPYNVLTFYYGCLAHTDVSAGTVSIITNDGRNMVVRRVSQRRCLPALTYEDSGVSVHVWLQGLLRGYDQSSNIVLDDCHERVYSTRVCSPDLLNGFFGITGSILTVCFASTLELNHTILNFLQAGVERVALGGFHIIRGDNM